MALAELLDPFIWGQGGQKRTPEQIARDREMAKALSGIDTSPVAHPLQGLARVANAAAGAYRGYRADQAEQANALASQQAIAGLLAGIGGGGSTMPGGGFPEVPGASVPSTGGVPDTATDYSGIAPAAAPSAAPAPTVNISGNKQAFIETLMPAAIEESKRTGVDARIILAQAAQETGWGRSAPGNNYFGIKSHGKGGGQTFATHEYVNGKRVNIRDNFRQFASPADSVRGYGDFILQNKRYRPLREAQGLDAQLAALQASGYATDPNYSRSVGAIARGIKLPDMASLSQQPAADGLQAIDQIVQPEAGALPFSGPIPTPRDFGMAGVPYDPNAGRPPMTPLASEIGVPAPASPLTEQERAVRREQLAPVVQQAGAPYVPPQTPLTGAPAPMPVPVADDEAAVLALEQQMAQQDPATWAGVPSTPEIPVMVAEDEAGIQALEAQMAGWGDPAFAAPVDPMATGAAPMPFAAPPLTEPRTVADVPVAGQPAQGTPPMDPQMQIAQALTQLPVNEALPMMGGPTARAMPAPQTGINPLVAQSLSNPNASPQERQIAGLLLQQQMAEMQAARQAQAQAAAAAQAQAQRYQAANQAGINPNFAADDTLWQESVKDRFRDRGTDTQRNLEWRAQQAGLQPGTPEYQKFMLEGGDKGISVNVDTGTIPQGYQAVRDQNGRVVRYEAIPGGPADTSGKEAAALENQSVTGDVILTAAKRARDIAKTSGRLATGFGGQLLANIGESDAAELRRQVDVLKSNAKIENLTAMRAASPTGGALGAVSDKENEMLAAKTGALDPNAKPEVFQAALDDYERTLLRIIHGNKVGDAIFEQTREAEGGPKRLKFNPATGELE